jgi:hypothetical protein
MSLLSLAGGPGDAPAPLNCRDGLWCRCWRLLLELDAVERDVPSEDYTPAVMLLAREQVMRHVLGYIHRLPRMEDPMDRRDALGAAVRWAVHDHHVVVVSASTTRSM